MTKSIEDAGGGTPTGIQDFRKALDDPEVNGLVSATPNHWDALSTVWACQAGKDVYVEKPTCHNIWEGRKMIEAARKYNRRCGWVRHAESQRGVLLPSCGLHQVR